MNTQSLKAALPAGDADAVAEIQDLYGYLRQRAAEEPLQTRVLSRADEGLTADKKERWYKSAELYRTRVRTH
jgi:hypothetical protein